MDIQKLMKITSIIPLMHKINHIHFIGIGGYGMGSIAKVLHEEGYLISGSDLDTNIVTKNLKSLGIKIYFKHHHKNIYNADVVVFSSAINNNNSEIIYAKKLGIPIIHRSEILAELMRFRYGIAISGTHGKTTTTAMIISIYNAGGLNPTFINGGLTKSTGIHSNLGSSKYIIVEADESDSSFLNLKPIMSVVTNIEADHMNTYSGNFENLKQAFINFLHNLPFYGRAIVCIDDKIIRYLIPKIKRKIITYGFSSDADIIIKNYTQYNSQGFFNLVRKNKPLLNITLNAVGYHNALNAAAAVAVATENGIKDNDILIALKNFQNISRRFDFLGKFPINSINGVLGYAMLFDDYGHHPTEIDVTIKAIRCNWSEKKLIMIFQPHRYTRTRDLFKDFANVLSKVDVLIILDVYPAGELIIDGSDSDALCKYIRSQGKINPILIKNHNVIPNILSKNFSGNDLIITQGAGDIEKIARALTKNKLNISYNEDNNNYG